MTQGDRYRNQGFKVGVAIDGEKITIGAQTVVAIQNSEPRFLEMLESGYLDKEPVIFEVSKGYAGSAETRYINGEAVPLDLRGLVPALPANPPQPNNQVTYLGVVRKIVKRQDAGDRWIIITIRDNVKGLGRV